MKPVPSPSASCGPAPGAWAPRWPIWVPSTTGPWRCWSTTPRPTWPPSLGCWKPDISMSPWTFKCLCPGCGGFWRPSPLPRWSTPPGRRPWPRPWRTCARCCVRRRDLPIPPRTPCWMPAGGGCWTSTRCTPFSPTAPPAPPRGSSSPTAASLTSPSGWPTPVSLPTRT